MKVIVIGASGTIGSKVAEKLKENARNTMWATTGT